LLILEYNDELYYGPIPDIGDFAIEVNNTQAECESIDIFGEVVEICFSTEEPISGSDNVSFSYTAGDVPMIDYVGNKVDNLDTVIANNITPDADTYEAEEIGEDEYGDPINLAIPISTDGTLQSHTLAPAGDVDWLYFDVEETDLSKIFTIETFGRSEYMDTYLALYFNGERIYWNEDKDGSWASLIEFTPEAAGRYYILVEHFYPDFGACEYDISVTAEELEESNALMSEELRNDNAGEPVKVDIDVERHERETKNK
jgi:hypothetical protein